MEDIAGLLVEENHFLSWAKWKPSKGFKQRSDGIWFIFLQGSLWLLSEGQTVKRQGYDKETSKEAEVIIKAAWPWVIVVEFVSGD